MLNIFNAQMDGLAKRLQVSTTPPRLCSRKISRAIRRLEKCAPL
ncbi:Unknown protein sequence [Pseudomonas syringae pv. maculicola]|nr:Unknown protein sequence [Pseudomonas syringae pv. maculicola]